MGKMKMMDSVPKSVINLILAVSKEYVDWFLGSQFRFERIWVEINKAVNQKLSKENTTITASKVLERLKMKIIQEVKKEVFFEEKALRFVSLAKDIFFIFDYINPYNVKKCHFIDDDKEEEYFRMINNDSFYTSQIENTTKITEEKQKKNVERVKNSSKKRKAKENIRVTRSKKIRLKQTDQDKGVAEPSSNYSKNNKQKTVGNYYQSDEFEAFEQKMMGKPEKESGNNECYYGSDEENGFVGFHSEELVKPKSLFEKGKKVENSMPSMKEPLNSSRSKRSLRSSHQNDKSNSRLENSAKTKEEKHTEKEIKLKPKVDSKFVPKSHQYQPYASPEKPCEDHMSNPEVAGSWISGRRRSPRRKAVLISDEKPVVKTKENSTSVRRQSPRKSKDQMQEFEENRVLHEERFSPKSDISTRVVKSRKRKSLKMTEKESMPSEVTANEESSSKKSENLSMVPYVAENPGCTKSAGLNVKKTIENVDSLNPPKRPYTRKGEKLKRRNSSVKRRVEANCDRSLRSTRRRVTNAEGQSADIISQDENFDSDRDVMEKSRTKVNANVSSDEEGSGGIDYDDPEIDKVMNSIREFLCNSSSEMDSYPLAPYLDSFRSPESSIPLKAPEISCDPSEMQLARYQPGMAQGIKSEEMVGYKCMSRDNSSRLNREIDRMLQADSTDDRGPEDDIPSLEDQYAYKLRLQIEDLFAEQQQLTKQAILNMHKEILGVERQRLDVLYKVLAQIKRIKPK